VLIDSGTNAGDNNAPPLTDTANCAADTTRPTRDHRDAAAALANSTAASTSATGQAAGEGNTGSGSNRHPTAVNIARNASARARTRAIQPRTVPPARPNAAATRRYPQPRAAPTSPAKITAAVSARRASNTTGSSTWVTSHRPQRARRGRTRT
jgi:hypothetical protein